MKYNVQLEEDYNKFLEEKLGKGAVDSVFLKKASEYAKAITDGAARYKRFNEEEQKGLARGGEYHVTASLIAGRNDASDKTAPGGKLESSSKHPEEISENDRQELDVEKYAKKIKIWHKNTDVYLTSLYGDYRDSGKESKVWFDAKRGVVIKSSDTFEYATLENALDGITLHNTDFPETALKIIGFGKNSGGDFAIIAEQPYIQNREGKPTPEELKEYAKSKGYVPDEKGLEHHYTNNKKNLHDLHDDNVIKTPEENLAAIDTTMSLKV